MYYNYSINNIYSLPLVLCDTNTSKVTIHSI